MSEHYERIYASAPLTKAAAMGITHAPDSIEYEVENLKRKKQKLSELLSSLRDDLDVKRGSLKRYENMAKRGLFCNSRQKSQQLLQALDIADQVTQIEQRLRDIKPRGKPSLAAFFMDVCREELSQSEFSRIMKLANIRRGGDE